MNKRIFISLIFFILVGFFYLAYNESIQRNPDLQKDWWVVYFEDPKSENLNFVIENHSNDNNFNWSLSNNGKIVSEENIIIEKGDKKEIQIDETKYSGKISIEVESNGKKKNIYKIL